MRGIVYITLTLWFCLGACQKPEDIAPVPPPQSDTPPPPVVPEQEDKEDKLSPDVDSALYRYGEYNNMPYRYLIPKDYDSATAYPVHMFLHGIGERGRDNEKHLTAGASYFKADSIRDAYPAFIIYPQCPSDEYWFNDEIKVTLKGLIDSLSNTFHIAEDQITVGGFSMGAYGTFALVAEYPELFEAAIAIAGDGDEQLAERMARSRWQLFAGGKDDIVPSTRTEEMARALERAGASVDFRLYPFADHGNTMHQAFLEPGFFRWIFESSTKK